MISSTENQHCLAIPRAACNAFGFRVWIDGAGTAAVSVHDDGLHVWDICRGQLSYQLGDDDEEVTGLACSRDLSVVAAVAQQESGDVTSWSLRTWGDFKARAASAASVP